MDGRLMAAYLRLPVGTPLADRMAAHTEPGPSGCLLWTGYRNEDGYGRMTVDRRNVGAHRVAYELAHGPIPAGMTVDHICFTPACVNPAHLRLLTLEENRRNVRSASKTHCAHGHELTPENTHVRANGRRNCLVCNRIRLRAKRVDA